MVEISTGAVRFQMDTRLDWVVVLNSAEPGGGLA
jgi:hypothetical protein